MGVVAMKARMTLLLILAIATWAAAAPWPTPPHEVQAPLQYVTISGPAGLAVTFLEGNGERTFTAPVKVGLRPAYTYRLKLTNIPDYPGVTLYPSLDVCGTLRLPSTLSAAQFPTPIVFTADDVDKAVNGVMV